MNRFWGVLRYEYQMTIRRWSFWIAFGLLFLPYGISITASLGSPTPGPIQIGVLRSEIATSVYMLNMFMPVFAGIVIADRLVRDQRLGLEELLHSTALNRSAYIFGKYFGGLLAVLTPVMASILIFIGLSLLGGMPVLAILIYLQAFLSITLPAFAFVTAFSLACPVVIPVRVYQILFTGYWFWGNYLNPNAFPSLNGTLLTPGGVFALEGFFSATKVKLQPGVILHTPLDAVLNLCVLAACIVLVMIVLDRYLAYRTRTA